MFGHLGRLGSLLFTAGIDDLACSSSAAVGSAHFSCLWIQCSSWFVGFLGRHSEWLGLRTLGWKLLGSLASATFLRMGLLGFESSPFGSRSSVGPCP